jgi:hypothetical protein
MTQQRARYRPRNEADFAALRLVGTEKICRHGIIRFYELLNFRLAVLHTSAFVYVLSWPRPSVILLCGTSWEEGARPYARHITQAKKIDVDKAPCGAWPSAIHA